MRRWSQSEDTSINNPALITGPSEGVISAETALTLAVGSPELIILPGRSLSNIKAVTDNIKSAHTNVATNGVLLNPSSQVSVREAAASINASVQQIDIAINNAAIMACPSSKTVDGIVS